MNTCQVRTASIVLCLSMMAFANTGFAKEPIKKERNRSHIELDPEVSPRIVIENQFGIV